MVHHAFCFPGVVGRSFAPIDKVDHQSGNDHHNDRIDKGHCGGIGIVIVRGQSFDRDAQCVHRGGSQKNGNVVFTQRAVEFQRPEGQNRGDMADNISGSSSAR